MTEENQPHLGNSASDYTAMVAKGLAGTVPYIGPMLAEVVGNVIPNQRIDRIAAFAQLLDERLQDVERQVLDGRFREPAAVDLLEDGLLLAARATSRERLEHVASVVANGLSAEELNEAESKRMLWLLGQVNDAEIIILRSRLATSREEMEADSAFRERHQELLQPDSVHYGSDEDEIEQAALRSSYRQHLHDLGLLRQRFRKPKRGELPEFDPQTGMMKAASSQITRLGKMFLRYLDLIPEWYTQAYH